MPNWEKFLTRDEKERFNQSLSAEEKEAVDNLGSEQVAYLVRAVATSELADEAQNRLADTGKSRLFKDDDYIVIAHAQQELCAFHDEEEAWDMAIRNAVKEKEKAKSGAKMR